VPGRGGRRVRRRKQKKGRIDGVTNTRTNRQIWKSEIGTKGTARGLISQGVEVDDGGIKEVSEGFHENR
jgi:hypothetical protein